MRHSATNHPQVEVSPQYVAGKFSNPGVNATLVYLPMQTCGYSAGFLPSNDESRAAGAALEHVQTLSQNSKRACTVTALHGRMLPKRYAAAKVKVSP